jgi:Uma2 family endonuclease
MSMSLVRRTFTVREYDRMARAGVLAEDERVELLDGAIVQMTPIGPEHSGCVAALDQLLARRLADRALVWVQNPVHLPDRSEPQPDVALLRPRTDGYRKAHPLPADVLLVIEVADTSVESDRSVKLPLYAQAGIPEVWLVNLPGEVIEVAREPLAGRFASLHYARRGETLSPLAFPTIILDVDDILGPRPTAGD